MCFQLHLMMLLLLLGLLTGSAWSRASPENPLEKLAVGALSAGTGIMSSLQEGALATQQMNFNGGLVAVRSKTAMGYGDAMRPDSGEDSDSSESDERRRRRRRNTNSTSTSNSSYRNSSRSFSLHQALHRLKRSPCGMKMGATTESADDVEARKKRARKRAANNNASRTRISKTSTKKKLLESRRRRRRQATQQQQQQLGAGLGEQVKGLFLSFIDNMADMVQQVRQQVKGATAQATGGM
ncbi:uncharacterized protein [Drosophila virilis]|uniref:Uncharacterized protein n=1 Tax=Drosophila virilis TaxID=7244 RepID=B4MD57_DROVI|nr:uncharacterized protein LOC6635458 [Drosophila virilis]EDW58129.1 uncharacterized protein Dvir_GJ15368 [Drosophila virilis]